MAECTCQPEVPVGPSVRRYVSIRSWLPGITLMLSVVAVGVFALPGSSIEDQLAYDRDAVTAGQWHRMIACHFTHWSLDHLLWDVVAFVILGGMCERRMKWRFPISLGIAALTIPLAVHVVEPGLQAYRGLSGLDSALFALLAVDILRRRMRSGQKRAAGVIGGLCLAFAAKLMIEFATGKAVFVSEDAGFVPVPLAHLVGAVAGLVAGIPGAISVDRGEDADTRRAIKRDETTAVSTAGW